MITQEKWLKAQAAERRFHTQPFSIGLEAYFQSYRQYFEFLDLDFNCKGKTIIEIGPADYPALTFCHSYSIGYIIEPMPSSILKELVKGKKLVHIDQPAEDITWSMFDIPVHEVWMFNLLQHVKDPDYIINKSKEIAQKICFFEPINCGTNDCHLWSFDLDYFRRYFGDCVKHYPGNPDAKNFHTHECAYGVWQKSYGLC